MKIVNLSAAVAAMLVFPVVFCSCSTGPEKEKKAEPEVPANTVKAEPAAVEVKAEPVLDNSKEAKPAPAPAKKAEPAPAPAPAKKAEPAPAPAPEKKKASNGRPVEHVVRTGDNLWKISKKYYGSGAKWKLIYEANKSAIKKQDFLEPGTVLAIPAAE
ncbi:MAG: LysM peptidoglycan-binding domain-containing protein [Lentisphaerae bacterium]|nr:LysM peptidoglycan-binding domain-containing protein [Lentisphaerota bacterium]